MEFLPSQRPGGPGRPSIEMISVAKIKPNPFNARRHDRKQISMLAKSIQKFGFVVPAIVDDAGELISGHARLEAARQLGWTEIPVIRAAHLSEADKRAFMIADNRLAERASWDTTALRGELNFLSELDIDFDFSAIGFDTPEVDFLLEEHGDDGADAMRFPPDLPAVSRVGELWRLGEHHIYCGSALEATAYQAVLAGNRAQMVFTDPPYNVPVDGHVSRRGMPKSREFAMAAGEMTEAQYTQFLATTLLNVAASVTDGAICFVCMDWRHSEQLLAASRKFEIKNICVWVKNNPGMGSLYRSQHEFVFVLKCGAANHINNVELGKHGRNRSNVWDYPGLSSFGRDRNALLDSHPTVKPVALVADAIKDCSQRGALILDPFGGSGTTLLAAEKTKRRAALIEIDPRYVDLAIRRWQKLTGASASLDATGEVFSDRERAPP